MPVQTSNIRYFPAVAANRATGAAVSVRIAHADHETVRRPLPNAVTPASVPDCVECAPSTGSGLRQRNAAETGCYHYRSHSHGTRPEFIADPVARTKHASRKGLLP